MSAHKDTGPTVSIGIGVGIGIEVSPITLPTQERETESGEQRITESSVVRETE